MFRKVLVANRGEIACRVIRALREMRIGAVAVCSEADAVAKHVRMADEAVLLGPAPSRESYLRVDRIMDAARKTGAEAIHPGYGFLSESEVLRIACDEAGIAFIGPRLEALRVMGQKTRAREAMKAAGVPIVPGTVTALASVADAAEAAEAIGYPVLLKAAAGGGGKGMRLVHTPGALPEAFESCTREALASFGDSAVYVERAILSPRHIEIQVLADSHGNALHLFERECSVQRRHQKVVEESPAANLSEDTVRQMGEVAVTAARAIGYEGAGTIEFLVDPHERFYFLEMNTRLQVEHPVTELVTGIDLVREQVRVAAGEPLGLAQEDIRRRGHAIECRLCAEDPENGFLPSPGPLLRYLPPSGPGIRVDDGVSEGDEVTPFYDPMVAKIIAWAETRPAAIARMQAALGELRVGGIRTNRALLRRILAEPAFVAGRYSTDLIAGMPAPFAEAPDRATVRLAAAVAALDFRAPKATAARAEASRWQSAARLAGVARWGGEG